MNKIKYLVGLLLFGLFMPRVNALSYDIKPEISVFSNNKYEIKLSLNDIKDTKYGIVGCTMNIILGDGAKLNSDVRTIGDWSLEKGSLYLFDTKSPAKQNTLFAIIPLSVSANTSITLKNITCADDTVELSIDDKIVDLKYLNSSSNNNNSNNNNNNNNSNNNNNNNNSNNNNNNNQTANDNNKEENVSVDDSNCNLNNIVLSEGTIDFDPNVTEYEINVNDMDTLIVEPELSNSKAGYTVSKTDDKITIEVIAVDGTTKVYTLNVIDDVETTPVLEEEEKNNYVPIFIGIICILVLINIFRIVKNSKSKS